jgi:hypothetical protein
MASRMLLTVTLWTIAAVAIAGTLNVVPPRAARLYAELGGFCRDGYAPAESSQPETRDLLSVYLIEHAESASGTGMSSMISYGRLVGTDRCRDSSGPRL